MPEIKGDRLYVRLGASQARKRLKGVGYGVRKVESAGTDRAVIIHTATGNHLRALRALFMGEIESPNEDVPKLPEQVSPVAKANPTAADLRKPARLVPDEPLPPYAYVTGWFPHPTSDPAGHSYGVEPQPIPTPEPSHWRDCRPYLVGVDLFNHGYYWEAHEVWEGLWHTCERTGPVASFLQGLIKLAAAGVKTREGRLNGVQRHAHRAAELFQRAASQLLPEQTHYFGLSLAQLIDFANRLASEPLPFVSQPDAAVEVVFPFALQPEAD